MNDAGKRLIAAAKESALTALRAHLDDLEAERDALLLKNEEITAERDAMRSQNDALMRERTSMIATHRGNLALAEKAHAAVREERNALLARVAELEVALEPFATLADRYDPEEGDDDRRCWVDEFTPTLGDLRRARSARAALSEHRT